ncbi:ribonuclease H1 domain-containing protein [Candidatus Methanomassiliicoccus intestinalis]|mgnify:CR=1 FL=1|uniref:ribonuclease H1 domain-containing protein n=1 Tax=Candidatus Methanomassiliicoccus intestinalis TaxID=1406512 RepID=UPI0037DCD3A2
MKVYAVRKGRQTGLFETWAECQAQVTRFPGAEYKSFTSYAEAEAYLAGGNTPDPDTSELTAYVDGSYNQATKEFSYGVVLLHADGRRQQFAAKSNDPELAPMRNVAGEIAGAMKAMDYALKAGVKSLTIYHDYAGIEKWCSGEWRTNRPGTQAYKRYYDQLAPHLQVTFVKVKSHSGNKYNDLADTLAKEVLF